jgi:Na+/phosphate symporter
VSSILLLLFFGIYRFVLTDDEKIKLNRPILSAIIGVSIFLVLHLTVVINLIGYEAFGRSRQIPELVSAFKLLFIVVAAILILIFYFNFYNFLNWLDENEKK